MSDKNCVAFIVEGEAREPLIIENLKKNFFQHIDFRIITLPACENIYMLWQTMDEDNYDTDIIEVLRETNVEVAVQLEGLARDDFSEIYLFFDCDGHQDNLKDEGIENVLEQMLGSFNNETENGKLYISYPMVEALRDFEEAQCGDKEHCYVSFKDVGEYKYESADRSKYPLFRNYDFLVWSKIIEVFVMRCSCLINAKVDIGYNEYCESITPHVIFNYEKAKLMENSVFVLSAFPEFLLDYFGRKIWIRCLKHKARYCS